jgi:argininosuccinate lyase
MAEALDPWHFVSVRALPGGPNPEEMRRALREQVEQLKEKQDWHQQKQAAIRQAFSALDIVLTQWIQEGRRD